MFRASKIFSQFTASALMGTLAVTGAFYSLNNSKFSMVSANAAASAVSHAGLDPQSFKSLKVKEVVTYNHNTNIYVFELDANAPLNLPVSSYVLTKAEIDGKNVIRPYTPIHQDENGTLQLLVKVYPNGNMSKKFGELKVGDTLDIKGPLPKFKYEANKYKQIGMIAGGTGITPMLQVVEEIAKNPADKTEVTILFANQTPADILLKEEIDALAAKHKNIKAIYTVDQAKDGFNGHVGFLNEQLIKSYMPAPTNDNMVFVCGPPGMMAAISGSKAPDYTQGEVSGVLKNLGYSKDNVIKF